jgi:C4-type Zn-finger protein
MLWSTAVVMCPGCDQPMKPVECKAIQFTNGLVDVTYLCEKCETRTIRTIKEDDHEVESSFNPT